MSWRDYLGIGDRSEWLLRLLYASADPSTTGHLLGRTRLMKGAFLIDRKLLEEFNRETDFEFEAGKFGPFDQGVFEASEELERDGLLEIRERDKYQEDEYTLTDDGLDRGRELWDALSEEEKQLIRWIKGKHLSQPLSKILSFVYNQYPEYTENSELT